MNRSNIKTDIENKYSIYDFLFSISIFFIFLSFEGSFTIITIFPLIIFEFFIFLLKRKNIKLNEYSKAMIFLNFIYIISFFINYLFHEIKFYTIIQIFYHLLILFWFLINIQNDFKEKQFKFFINSVILVCSICSIFIIYNNFIVGRHISSIMTFFGNFMGKNYFTLWISMSILLCIYLILYSKKKFRYIFCILILLFAMIYTNSRGGWISLFASSGFLIIYYFFNKKVSMKKFFLIFTIGISIFFFWKTLINIMPTWIYNRTFVSSYKDNSNLDRISSWKNGLNGFIEQPILGYGPGIFNFIDKYQYTERGVEVGDSTNSHNTYIDELLKGGIIGLLLFLYPIFKVGIYFYKNNKLYLPILIHVLVNSMILGAGKSVYFWNIIILLIIIQNYLNKTNSKDNIFLNF